MVAFPVTTGWVDGQEYFNQGLGQLHGFWYYEAERTFREMAAHDPECAMAYWGMAMANWENEKRAKEFIAKAVALKEMASPRNQLYITAQANYLDGEPGDVKKRRQELIHDLENIIHEHPGDIEARAFLGCRIWQFSQKGMPIHSHEAVDAMLQQIFTKVPMHPAHHFRIHLWDKRKAVRALDSAAKLGHTAPGIAHMWHMPGHIYSQLKRWDDSAFAQEASARIDHRYMIDRRVMPDQIHNYAHNNEWLARNWMNMGRAHDALDMAKSLIANPRHPKFNTLEKRGRSAVYGRQRLMEVLERFELWDEAIALAAGPYLEPSAVTGEQLKRLRLLGKAQFAKGGADALRSLQAELETLLADAKAAHEEAQEIARAKAVEEKKNEKDTEKAVKAAGKKAGALVESIKKVQGELACYLAVLDGDDEKAREHLKDVSGAKYSLARLHLRLGDEEKALSLSKEAVDKEKGMVLPLMARAEILHALGKGGGARETLEELQKISAHLDPAVPAVRRLKMISFEMGLADGWRTEAVTRDDVDQRPDLDRLGPVAWSPPEGHAFALPDQLGKTIASADFRGRPLILIFYLGHGCLHCTEQLDAFAAKAEVFKKAGFGMLAISTDSVGDLKKSQENYSADGAEFPFPLVADPALSVFREWNAYDDFEKESIHGTFVIDPSGRILWQDLGADPFTDTDFVLREAQRLLSIHGPAE